MKSRFLIAILIAIFVVSLVREAKAQTDVRVYAVSEKESVAKNEDFDVQLRLDNKGENINAVEVSLEFSGDLLTLRGINDGGSIINFWVEKPREVAGEKCFSGITKCGIIKMSGLIPGGFVGEGLLATLSFTARKEGIANLFFNQYTSKALLNRPDAKAASVTYEPLEVKIAGESPSQESNKLILDYFPPEKFTILLDKTKLALDNKWFISFVAQDKGSGIDHYEVREKFLGLFGNWKTAESPYVLAHQSLFSVIEIKAVDKTGLERIEKFVPARMVYLILTFIFGSIFLILALILRKVFKT
jgi:hypothetical protein